MPCLDISAHCCYQQQLFDTYVEIAVQVYYIRLRLKARLGWATESAGHGTSTTHQQRQLVSTGNPSVLIRSEMSSISGVEQVMTRSAFSVSYRAEVATMVMKVCQFRMRGFQQVPFSMVIIEVLESLNKLSMATLRQLDAKMEGY